MQAVTASGTSEVEYVVLSEVVKEVLFLRQLQDFTEPSMRIGAVDLFENNEGTLYHLARDACDVGKLEWCMSRRKISTRTCSLSR